MSELTDTAQKVLEERYYHEGEATWHDLVARVATFFANDTDESNAFYKMMYDLDALPNSPTLMNAGTQITSYSACFVLPVEDNIESIFKYYTDAGLISKSGGGVGCNFSSIRPSGSVVGSTGGVASGPLSFMRGQDALTEVIKQGGKRRGANMGILDCNHPDVMDMVQAKDEPGVLENFNLSVRVTDEFMEDVTTVYKKTTIISEETADNNLLWKEIIKRAHSSGEPGVLFGDTIESGNLVPHLGTLNTTNPCGEQPLLPYESCSLIAINLSNFIHKPKEKRLASEGYDTMDPQVDWDKLHDTVETAVLFMNRVLDKSEYPIPECQAAMEATRKIGVGIMGLHDMLIQLDLPYDSEHGRRVAGQVMQCIADVAADYSKVLGKEEGYYGAYSHSEGTPRRRNAHLTTIAPTGTLSMIADCSSGCEPYFSSTTTKKVLGEEFVMTNKWGAFDGAQDIHWREHIKMQATLQQYVDSSISKTINMPKEATLEDVREAYEYAWRQGCKGVTVYRDGCRGTQVLNTEQDSDIGLCSGGDVEQSITTLPTPYKLELPEKLESMRYRVTDNEGEKVYVTVGLLDGEDPVEVFVKHPYELANSYLSSISRLTSLCMRYNVPLKDICKQLQKSSTSVADMPAKLARILDGYQNNGDWMKDVDNPCPECGNKLVPEGGCFSCKHCGYSKCL